MSHGTSIVITEEIKGDVYVHSLLRRKQRLSAIGWLAQASSHHWGGGKAEPGTQVSGNPSVPPPPPLSPVSQASHRVASDQVISLEWIICLPGSWMCSTAHVIAGTVMANLCIFVSNEDWLDWWNNDRLYFHFYQLMAFPVTSAHDIASGLLMHTLWLLLLSR